MTTLTATTLTYILTYAQVASMVFRTAHWPVPRKLLNLVPFKVSRN